MATRAHTVPRFYLAGFVADAADGHEPFLYVGLANEQRVVKRAPKNLSISRGYYDGTGGFEEADASIENHLSKIEWAAASAIKRLASKAVSPSSLVPAEVWRFIAWQAARTPAWQSIAEASIDDWDPNELPNIVEPPPEGFENIKDRHRPIEIAHRDSGERRTVGWDEYKGLYAHGWRWIPSIVDRLEGIHLQAWYFQVRHFARLHWRLIAPPSATSFITSDRGVSWSACGEFDVPPSALRHPSAQVIAPLTSKLALLGVASSSSPPVSVDEINASIARTAVAWVAGSSESLVAEALRVRGPQANNSFKPNR